jgi:retron-type reverse transcriptase
MGALLEVRVLPRAGHGERSDLEKFFGRVNHDILIDRLQKRIQDVGVIRLIRAYLNSGTNAAICRRA